MSLPCIHAGSVPKLKILKDVFWDVRAHWYLLGIQLDVEHSDLEVNHLALLLCSVAHVYSMYIDVIHHAKRITESLHID